VKPFRILRPFPGAIGGDGFLVLASQANTPEVLRELEMLDQEILQTDFAADLGIVG
jgi:hypothetical protein